MSQAGNQSGMPEYHPAGTAATPMDMPLAVVEYNGQDALYQTLHPLYTADGAVVPGRPFTYPHDVGGSGGDTLSGSQGYTEQGRASVFTADGART